jgi:hypothetical protein
MFIIMFTYAHYFSVHSTITTSYFYVYYDIYIKILFVYFFNIYFEFVFKLVKLYQKVQKLLIFFFFEKIITCPKTSPN